MGFAGLLILGLIALAVALFLRTVRVCKPYQRAGDFFLSRYSRTAERSQ